MNKKLELLSQSRAEKSPPKNKQKQGVSMMKVLEKGIIVAMMAVVILLVYFLFGDKILPVKEVSIVSILTKEDPVGMPVANELNEPVNGPRDALAQETVFQASGWIEAAPYSHRATAQISGIVEEVFVLEGQSVKKGTLIATLIDEDAQLEKQDAFFQWEKSKAEEQAQLEHVGTIQAEITTLEAQITAQRHRLAELSDTATRKRQLGTDVISEEELSQAILRESTQAAELRSVESRKQEWASKLKMEQALARAKSAAVGIAKTTLDQKTLELQRTRILSPIDGRIQSLLAAPGQKKMANADHVESLTIATLFSPDNLQARIDVPLEEAANVHIGQWVKIRTSFLPNTTFSGRVTRVVGESDIQRNTLQVKMEILDPDSRLTPEMLCRAEFLQPKTQVPGATSNEGIALYIPKECIVQHEGTSASAYKLNEDRQRIVFTSIQIDPAENAGFYKIVAGLNPGDQVVKNPTKALKHNQRIRVINHVQ